MLPPSTLPDFVLSGTTLAPSAGFNHGPFWRVLPAIATEGLSVVLLFVTLTRGLSRPAKQTW